VVRRLATVDSRNAAVIVLDGVDVGEDSLVGDDRAVSTALDRGAIALAAEMVGGAAEAFERTLAYLKVRKQFGVLIGTFQALRHRSAWMYADLELTRALVDAAARAGTPALASAAKARASDTFVKIAAEGIQLHGGIGVTDEHDIGLYYKRAKAAEMLLGTATHHRARFARLP
jgi:alkylation response protein AidB-like acyl-CoA dehydrogenase